MSENVRPALPEALLVELHSIEHRHLLRVLWFLLSYALGVWGAVSLFRLSGGGWLGYLLCLPLYILAAASLHGISLFTHEGVHGALSRWGWMNRWLSIFCALPVLQNFSAYRVLHLRHHKHLGEAGDPDHYPNYTPRSWLILAMHWGRLLVGYPAYITAIPVLGFWYGNTHDRIWIVIECLLLCGGVMAVIFSPIPFEYVLHGWIFPMVIINTMVNIRGMSQHTLLEHATDVVQGTRSILTNRVTTFFMCNENYHLEHHLYPRVPWYHLPRVHQELGDELRKQGAPYVPSYAAFVWEFVRATIFWKSSGTISLKDLQ